MSLYGYSDWLESQIRSDMIAETTAISYYNVAVHLHDNQDIEPEELPMPSDLRDFAESLEHGNEVKYRNIYSRFVALRYYYEYNNELHAFEGVLHDLKQEYYVEPPT